MTNGKYNIWVEKLTPVDIFVFFIKGAFRDLIVYYDENRLSPFTRYFLDISKRAGLFTNFNPASLRFNIKDSNGETLYYEYSRDLDFCSKLFYGQKLSDKPKWFQRMTEAYIAAHLDRKVRFMVMALAKANLQGQRKQEFFVFREPMNHLLIRYYRDKGFVVKESFSMIGHIKEFAKFPYLLYLCLSSFFFSKKPDSNIEEIRPAVWVEYEPCGLTFDNDGIETKQKQGTFFWNDYIDAKNYDVIYYIDRTDTPVKEASGMIAKNGHKYIDLSTPHTLARLSLKEIKEILAAFFDTGTKAPLWFRNFECLSYMRYKLFRSIYSRFKVKVLVQHQELSWIPCIQAKAIEDAGGMMMGSHWSHVPFYRNIARTTPHHVYFIWGKIKYEWLQKSGNTCRYILPCGLWIAADDYKPNCLNRLNSKQAFILAVFDTSIAYDAFSSPENFLEFYKMIIRLLKKNPDWGAVVKSKNYNLDNLPVDYDLKKAMKMFIEEGRMVFLDPNISPLTAASYADISVCLNINSAGIISAIGGHRVAHWDSAGWSKHFFYKDEGQRFLYRTCEGLEEAVIAASKGDKRIGDFSMWREGLNYFNDFAAPRRIGGFIQAFMDEIIRTDDMEYSLAFAAKDYIKKNEITDDFFKIENLWREE